MKLKSPSGDDIIKIIFCALVAAALTSIMHIVIGFTKGEFVIIDAIIYFNLYDKIDKE